MNLYHLLYTSTLAVDVPVTEIVNIVRVARAHNAEAQITGVLVFDGQRFCQYLEGSEPQVTALMAKISMDVRHKDIVIRHQAFFEGPRRFDDWQLGYATSPEGDGLDSVMNHTGLAAIDAFFAAIGCFEMEP